MADAAPGLDADQMAMWRALVAGNYFAIPARQCQTCRNPEPCGRFFCAQCRVGNLCHAVFRDAAAHGEHAGIRVWKVTRQFSVWVEDLRRMMPREYADQPQLYWQNQRHNVKLVKPEARARNMDSAWRRLCHSCGGIISMSTIPNHSPHPVCSLQCLLDFIDAGAGFAVPRAVAERPVALPRPLPRPALVVPFAARPLMIQAGGEAEERGPVGDHAQNAGAARRKRRKQDAESVIRAHLGNQLNF